MKLGIAATSSLIVIAVVIVVWTHLNNNNNNIADKTSLWSFVKAAPSASPSSDSNHNNHNKTPLRILYIVTSGGKANIAGDRWTNRVVPVLRESIESLLQDDFATVDLFLVLGFDLDVALELELRDLLPNGVGLEIWQDAIPLGYNCHDWFNEPSGRGTNCQTKASKTEGTMQEALLFPGKVQLARQHRYVVKDKLPYYDVFVVFEDDMVVQQAHVKQHLQWMRYIRQLQGEAPEENVQKNRHDWMAPMSRKQLQRLRPGFLRVEVLQPTQTGTQRTLDFPVNVSDVTTLDPNTCCDTKYILKEEDDDEDEDTKNSSNHPSSKGSRSRSRSRSRRSSGKTERVLQPQDLVIWETGAMGMGVRSLSPPKNGTTTTSGTAADHSKTESDWVAFLPGPPGGRLIPSYWMGNLITPKPQRPDSSTSRYLGQSAGWMATPAEILEFHTELCQGGFVPPFESPKFPRDGFWRNNVEFWSGGLQLWCISCAIQRFIPIHQFDQHLLYHSSNNKQFEKPKPRLVLAQHLLGQLQLTQRRAQQERRKG
jgi:hypothetical protein